MSCCTDTWGGLKTAHCSACCVTFTTVRNFDAHRRGAELCRPPEDAGLVDSGRRTEVGAVIWGSPGTEDASFRRAGDAGTAEQVRPDTRGTPRPLRASERRPDTTPRTWPTATPSPEENQ